MRIGVVVETATATGGGFHQSLATVLQLQRLSSGHFDLLVFSPERDVAAALETLGVPVVGYSRGWRDRGLTLGAQSEIGRRIQRRLAVTGELEAELLRHRVDLAYFATQSDRAAALRTLPFAITVWDLCHRDSPEFPEVRLGNEFHRREAFLRGFLPAAVAVVADSATLAASIVRRYGVDPERVVAMPYSPSPLLGEARSRSAADVLSSHGLQPGYLFYPAQFWAHKNHVRILQALAILRDRGMQPRVVFSGKDWGNREHVEDLARELGVHAEVSFLGFVPSEDLRGLYEGCRAVVMPTYFGPTNLPPLEAWTVGRPLLYSAHLGDGVGEAAILFDPDDPDALADAIVALDQPGLPERITAAGARQLERIAAQRTQAEETLLAMLRAFAVRRGCWR